MRFIYITAVIEVSQIHYEVEFFFSAFDDINYFLIALSDIALCGAAVYVKIAEGEEADCSLLMHFRNGLVIEEWILIIVEDVFCKLYCA